MDTLLSSPVVSTVARRYITFTGNHRGQRSIFDKCLNRGMGSDWEQDALERCGTLNRMEEAQAIDLAKSVESAERYVTASTLAGWAFVVDRAESKIVALLKIDIATETCGKLNAADCEAAAAAKASEQHRLEILAHEATGTARDVRKSVAKMDDDSLIGLASVFSEAASVVADEILRRAQPAKAEPVIEIIPDFAWSSDGYEPDAATRDELESRIEVTADNTPPIDPYFDELEAAVGEPSQAA